MTLADDANDLPLAQLVQSVRDGRTAPGELTHEAQRRIAELEPRLSAWVAVDPTAADRAAAMGSHGMLAGVPVGVKDIFDVAGLPTRAGSEVTPPQPVTRSAACVERLESLGAVVQGKTVTTEFAYFRPGPTRNPRDPDRTPGGSSSGSAAAVAAGAVPLALGSQTAGSTTRPASFCGIAGLVLAQGSTDLAGTVGLSQSLDSLGLFTRTCADLAYAYRAFAGSEEPTTPVGEPAPRLLVWEGSGLAELEPEMVEAVSRAARLAVEAGITVGTLDFDAQVRALSADHQTIMRFEAARERAEEFARFPDQLSPQLRNMLEVGAGIPEADYREALDRREDLRAELATRLADGALVLGPGALGVAPLGLAATGSPLMSRPWQVLGLPAVAVPGVRSAAGLPLGLQLIGLPGQEESLLATGHMIETTVGHTRQR